MRYVVDRGMDEEVAADLPGRRAGWASTWASRYREGGLAALPDLPRSGRPPAVPEADLPALVGEHTTHAAPVALHDAIEATGVRFHVASVRGTPQVRALAQEADHRSRQQGQPGRGARVAGPRHSGAGEPQGRGAQGVRAGRGDLRGRRREGRKALVPRGREDPRRARGQPPKVRGVRAGLGRRVAVLPNARRA